MPKRPLQSVLCYAMLCFDCHFDSCTNHSIHFYARLLAAILSATVVTFNARGYNNNRNAIEVVRSLVGHLISNFFSVHIQRD